jgi:hypothetical protein
MSQPPIPPPGQSFSQPYGQAQQYGPGQPPHGQQPVPHSDAGASAPGATGPGALALALLLGGYLLLTVPALIVPVLSITGPAIPSAAWVGFISLGLGIVARLIAITGILTVRDAPWSRRGIAAGIIAATALAYYVGQFILQLVIQQLVGASEPQLISTVSLVGTTALGLLSTASWIVAWLVVRRSPVPAWAVALPLALILPLLVTAVIRLVLTVAPGALFLFIATGSALMNLVCFAGAILLAEVFTRRARRAQRG